MEALTKPFLLLGLAMILAIIIERLLEIAKSIYDYIEACSNSTERWTERAEQLRNRLEVRLDNAKAGNGRDFDLVVAMASRYLSVSGPSQSGLWAVSTDKVRAITIKAWFKTIAIILGIFCAWLFDIDILKLVELSLENKEPTYQSSWFGILMAGIAMGFGAGPMHKLIAALEKARGLRRQKEGIKNG